MRTLDACPGCLSPAIHPLYEGRTTRKPDDGAVWHVGECQVCGLGFLDPQPSFTDLEQYYSESYEPYNFQDDPIAVAAAAREAGEYRFQPIPTGKRLLDVGCGGGFHMTVCRELGADVSGVEPSAHGAAVARSKGLDVFNGTLEEYDTDKRFDLITANQVLEHVPDPVRTLAAMKALLAPGGVICVAVPNAACRWARVLKWKWDGADLPYHLMQFIPASIEAAARRAGLHVRLARTHSDPWIVAYSKRKELKERYGLPERLSQAFYPRAFAERLARKLDRQVAGDNLIVELVA